MLSFSWSCLHISKSNFQQFIFSPSEFSWVLSMKFGGGGSLHYESDCYGVSCYLENPIFSASKPLVIQSAGVQIWSLCSCNRVSMEYIQFQSTHHIAKVPVCKRFWEVRILLTSKRTHGCWFKIHLFPMLVHGSCEISIVILSRISTLPLPELHKKNGLFASLKKHIKRCMF